jgi:hypothetical protein
VSIFILLEPKQLFTKYKLNIISLFRSNLVSSAYARERMIGKEGFNMKYEIEQALRVKSLAIDVMEELMKDDGKHSVQELKQLSELFSRCICDLVNVYTNTSEDHEMILKGTVIKAKIGYNLMKPQTVEKE